VSLERRLMRANLIEVTAYRHFRGDIVRRKRR
jgi:hypothetical protein